MKIECNLKNIKIYDFYRFLTFDITMSSKYFHKKNKVRKVKNVLEIECYEYKKNKKIKILIKYNVIKIEKLK